MTTFDDVAVCVCSSVMVTHCALSAQHISKFAKNDPFVYVGDFNIKPGSSMYKLLTEGTIDPKVRIISVLSLKFRFSSACSSPAHWVAGLLGYWVC